MKEGNAGTCHKAEPCGFMRSEISQSQKAKRLFKAVKLTESESGMMVAGASMKRGESGELFHGCEVSVLQGEKLLELVSATV